MKILIPFMLAAALFAAAFPSALRAADDGIGTSVTGPPASEGPSVEEQKKELAERQKIGNEALAKGDLSVAEKEYLRALAICTELYGPDNIETAHCHRALGVIYHNSANYDRELAHYGKALSIYKKDPDANKMHIAVTEHGMGQAMHYKGRYDAALEYYGRARSVYERELGKLTTHMATVIYDIGVTWQFKGEYLKARACFKEALAISERVAGKGSWETGSFHYALGEICKHLGDYGGALESYRRALEIYEKILGPRHPYAGTVHYAIAYIYDCMGEYDKSITSYETSRDIYTAAYGEKHPHVAIANHGLGVACISKGDAERAVGYFAKAIEIDMAVFGENHINTANAFHGLGQAYGLMGSNAKAIEYYRKVVDIQMRVLGASHPDMGASYRDIGLSYRRDGRPENALGYYRQSMEIFKKSLGDTHPYVGHLLNLMGTAYGDLNNYAKAEECFSGALAISRKRGLRQLRIQSSDHLGSLFLDRGENRRARDQFRESISVIEKARAETGSDRIEYVNRHMYSYYCSLRASAELGDISSFFETLEMMKARGFLDRLSLAAALSIDGVPRDRRDRMMLLNDEIESLSMSRSAEIQKPADRQDSARILALSRELEAKEKEFASIDELLMSIGRYRALRRPRMATLRDAQALCPDGTAILSYALWSGGEGPARSYCLMIKKNGCVIVPLAGKTDYAASISGFREMIIGGKNRTERVKAAADIYAVLMRPLEKELAGIKNIIIVPDGPLGNLPFDVLQKGPDAPYLCEACDLTLCPSVSVLATVSARSYAGERREMIAFGGAQYSRETSSLRGRRGHVGTRSLSIKAKEMNAADDRKGQSHNYYRALDLAWDNIPGTLAEVREIDARVFKGSGTRIVSGVDVSETAVKTLSRNGGLLPYRYLHFACHGYYDHDFPSYSAVVFSEVSGPAVSGEDGYLSVPEAAVLNLRADAVTLSACETGLGKVLAGDGVVGLTRAFMEAGANRVCVTLWQVDDDRTRDFMVGLYTKIILRGMTYGRALAETKREFIRSPSSGDPYFWGGFLLYGPAGK